MNPRTDWVRWLQPSAGEDGKTGKTRKPLLPPQQTLIEESDMGGLDRRGPPITPGEDGRMVAVCVCVCTSQ